MKTQGEVEAMLARFDAEGDDCDSDTEAVREALLWILGGIDDDRVTQYLSD